MLVVVDDLGIAGAWHIGVNDKEHSVSVRLLHNISYFYVQIVNQVSGGMIDYFIETFKADSSLSNVSIEKTDANNDVGQLA